MDIELMLIQFIIHNSQFIIYNVLFVHKELNKELNTENNSAAPFPEGAVRVY